MFLLYLRISYDTEVKELLIFGKKITSMKPDNKQNDYDKQKLEKVVNPMESVLEGNFEDISDLQNDIDETLSSIFQEFGGDPDDVIFKVSIKRVVVGKGELEHCFSCVASELPVTDRIKNEYGPGTYEVWIYKNGKIFKRPKLNIAKKIDDPGKSMMVHPSHSTADQSLQMILQQQNDRFSAIERALQDRNNSVDPMSMLTSSMSVIKDIVSMNSAPPAPPVPPVDPMAMMGSMMAAMVQMKEFMSSNDSSPISEVLENVKLIQEISDGGSGGETNLMDLAKSFGPGIMEITNKLAGTEQTKSENNKAPTEKDSLSIEKEKLIRSVDLLVFQAMSDANYENYIDLVIDNFPRAELETYLVLDDPFTEISKLFPNIAPYRGWFTALFNGVKEGYKEIDENSGNEEEDNDIDANNNEIKKEDLDIDKEKLIGTVDLLVLKAQSDANHENYISLVIENFPRAELETYLVLADPFPEIAKIFPKITPHRKWFTALFNGVKEGYKKIDKKNS